VCFTPNIPRNEDTVNAWSPIRQAQGPLIGHLLEAVREAQVEEKVRSREEALKLVEEVLLRERSD